MKLDALILSPSHLAQIYAHVEAGKPHEACGLLGGPEGRVEKVYLTENTAHSPVRYSVAPGQLIDALIDIEERGWDLVGIFHSHPAGPPMPSATDVAEAFYPEAAYIICAPDGHGRWQARAFTISQGSVTELSVQIES